MRRRSGLAALGSLTGRFWKNVQKTDGCWLWLGYTRADYGSLRKGSRSDGSRGWAFAHHISFLLHNGPIPDGMQVCHHCDNPPCTRPDHLFLGTQADNIHDRDRKGRKVYTRSALGRFV